MALKAGLAFTTDPRGGLPIGVALETDTGHTIEWRFATELGIQDEMATRAWWWQRVPALSLYGHERFEDQLQDFLSPREWFRVLAVGAYTRNFLWFVPPETTVDDFWTDVSNLDRPRGGLTPQDEGMSELIPSGPPWRPGGVRLYDPSYIGDTIEMLMDGIVGYHSPFGTTDPFVPVRAHRRLRDVAHPDPEDLASARRDFRRRLLSP